MMNMTINMKYYSARFPPKFRILMYELFCDKKIYPVTIKYEHRAVTDRRNFCSAKVSKNLIHFKKEQQRGI